MTNLIIYISIGTVWMTITLGLVLFDARMEKRTVKWSMFTVLFVTKLFAWPMDVAMALWQIRRMIKNGVNEKEIKVLDDILYD